MTCPSCTYASSDVSDILRSVVSRQSVLAKGARQFGANPPPQTRPTSFRQWNAPSFASASRSRPLAWRHAARGIGNAVPGDDRNAAATRDGPRVLCKPASTRSDAKVARTCASPSAYAYAPTTTRENVPAAKTDSSHARISARAREVGAAPRLRIRRIRFRERHVERACFRARRFGDGLLELRALARDDGDVRAEAEQRDERAQLGRAAEKREEGVSQIGTGPVVASRSERFERVDDVRLDAAVFGPAPRARDRGVAEKTFAFALDRHRVRAFRGVRAVLASAASDDLGA